MQIKIEIDVKPEELRRFLGLPDVAGLQEDLIKFVREKFGSASESFDPGAIVRTVTRNKAWRRLMDGTDAEETESAPASRGRRPRGAKTES